MFLIFNARRSISHVHVGEHAPDPNSHVFNESSSLACHSSLNATFLSSETATILLQFNSNYIIHQTKASAFFFLFTHRLSASGSCARAFCLSPFVNFRLPSQHVKSSSITSSYTYRSTHFSLSISHQQSMQRVLHRAFCSLIRYTLRHKTHSPNHLTRRLVIDRSHSRLKTAIGMPINHLHKKKGSNLMHRKLF
jgi:hypothetical protein